MDPLTVLSLCSGGGGLDLGVRAAVPARTVCYVENEVTACAVLAKGMEEELLDEAPVWTDLKSFDPRPWRGLVDIVIGGYPCQPFSTAGKRLGTEDPRHLWPHIARLVRELSPDLCFFENVANHLRLGFREVARDLHSMGYRVAAGLFTAEEVGAPHRRERLFILAHQLAHSGHDGGPKQGLEHQERTQESLRAGEMGDTNGCRRREEGDYCVPTGRLDRSGGRLEWPPRPHDDWSGVPEYLWPATPEPGVRGVADGTPAWIGRSDQLRILGNGVVPQQSALAFRSLADDLGLAFE